MKKDHKKLLKQLYSPKAFIPTLVSVPSMNYLMASGTGRPDEKSFQDAAGTLFPVAYVSKFLLKAERPEEDFVVMPMEVKWKLDRTKHGSGRYSWTMMIMQPECIGQATIEEAVRTLKRKRKSLPFEDRLRFHAYREELCGQILHIGPYEDAMERSFDLLKAEMAAQLYEWEPDSHDIYFNDSRKTPAERLKTITRVRIWRKGEAAPRLDDPFVPC